MRPKSPLAAECHDLGLHVVDGVRRLDIRRDGLARECLHEDLHDAAKAQHQMQRGLLLDVVVVQRAAILKLLAGEPWQPKCLGTGCCARGSRGCHPRRSQPGPRSHSAPAGRAHARARRRHQGGSG